MPVDGSGRLLSLEVVPSMLNMPDKKPSIGHLLEHPVTLELVKDACARHMCIEMPMFVLQVHKFRRLKTKSEQAECARHIVDTFFACEAPHELNLECGRKTRVVEAVRADRFDAHMFDDAEHDVLELITTNVMQELALSGLYAWCVNVVNTYKESLSAYDRLKECLEDMRRERTGTGTQTENR